MSNDHVNFSYKKFNESNWQYNVNKFTFVFVVGLIYELAVLASKDFQVSQIEIYGRFASGWVLVVAFFAVLEGIIAILVKIGLTPNCLLDSKLTVLKVFPKTVFEVCKDFYTDFREVSQTVNNIVYNPNASIYSTVNLNPCFSISDGLSGRVFIPGYIKEPDNFK